MKAKKLFSLVLCLLMVFGTMSVMTASAAETTIYEVANATELNNAFVNAAPNSGIRLTANITSEQTFAVIKNKESFAIDLNGFSIIGESKTIGDLITVGDNTTLFIINTKSNNNTSSIIVNSEEKGASVLCLNGENAALHILNGVEIVMGTNGYYAWNSNYAHCIKVVKGKELNFLVNVNGDECKSANQKMTFSNFEETFELNWKWLYLKPNSNWKQASAKFAAYFFTKNVSGEYWQWMMKLDSNHYGCLIPGTYKNVIFCRMNSSATNMNWDNKWNQTGDLTIPTNGNNLFTQPSGNWDGATTSWSKKTF